MSNNPTIPPILSPTEPRGKVQVPAMSVRDAQVLGRPHAVRGLLLQRALSGESFAVSHFLGNFRMSRLLGALSLPSLPKPCSKSTIEAMYILGCRVPRWHEVCRRVVQGAGRRRRGHSLPVRTLHWGVLLYIWSTFVI